MDARDFQAQKARANNVPLTPRRRRRELLETKLPVQAPAELKILLECWNREGGDRPPRSVQLACELASLVTATSTWSRVLYPSATPTHGDRRCGG